jgi:hypothetical protein
VQLLEEALGARPLREMLELARRPRAHEVAQLIFDEGGVALQLRPAELLDGAHRMPAAHHDLAVGPGGVHRGAQGVALVDHDRLRPPGRRVLLQRLERHPDVCRRFVHHDEGGEEVSVVQRVDDHDGQVGMLQPVDAVGGVQVEDDAILRQEPARLQAVDAQDKVVRGRRAVVQVALLIAEQHAWKLPRARVAQDRLRVSGAAAGGGRVAGSACAALAPCARPHPTLAHDPSAS